MSYWKYRPISPRYIKAILFNCNELIQGFRSHFSNWSHVSFIFYYSYWCYRSAIIAIMAVFLFVMPFLCPLLSQSVWQIDIKQLFSLVFFSTWNNFTCGSFISFSYVFFLFSLHSLNFLFWKIHQIISSALCKQLAQAAFGMARAIVHLVRGS